jgi:outer membrane protein assembly factor BamE (lipoprotein component of BamABCDE complex)
MFRRQLFSSSLTTFAITVLVGCGATYSHYFITPGLDDARAAAIVVGMSGAEVELRLGKPHQRVRFDNLKATAWDYRYVDSFGYVTDFAVMVGDDGRVVNKISARLTADDK